MWARRLHVELPSSRSPARVRISVVSQLLNSSRTSTWIRCSSPTRSGDWLSTNNECHIRTAVSATGRRPSRPPMRAREMANLFVHGAAGVSDHRELQQHAPELDFLLDEDADPSTYQADIRLHAIGASSHRPGSSSDSPTRGRRFKSTAVGADARRAMVSDSQSRHRGNFKFSRCRRRNLILMVRWTPDTVPWSTTPGMSSALP